MKIDIKKTYNLRNQNRKDLKKVILDNVRKILEGRNAVIGVFERNILKHFDLDSDFDSDSDSDSDYGPTKLKQNFEESVGERVKLKKQKTNKKLTIEDLNKIVGKNNDNIKKEVFSSYFVFNTLKTLKESLIYFQKNEKETYEKYKNKIEDGIEKLKIDRRRQTKKESIKK